MKIIKKTLQKIFGQELETWAVDSLETDRYGNITIKLESQIREKVVIVSSKKSWEDTEMGKRSLTARLKQAFIERQKPKYEKQDHYYDIGWLLLENFNEEEIRKDEIGYHANYVGKTTCQSCNKRIFSDTYFHLKEYKVGQGDIAISYNKKCKSCFKEEKVIDNL